MFIPMASDIDDGRRCDNTLMTHHFHKKRKKARENSQNNMAESTAPGHLRLLSDERVFAHQIQETRKSFRTDILLLCFVMRYPYQITLCVDRLRKPTACLSPDISGYNLTDVARSVGGAGHWSVQAA